MIDYTQYTSLAEHVNLHLVKSSKFKTVLFGVYIKRPLNNEEVSLNALLSRVIDKGTTQYPSQRAINRALENLYGSILVCDVHKYGERQMIQIKLQLPGEQYIGEQGLLEQGIKFLNSIVNDPYTVDGGFDPRIVETEKGALISDIHMRKDDKSSWAVSCLIENMCENEPYRLHEYGDEEAIERITPQALYAHYKHILATSAIDIIAIGDYEVTAVEAAIKSEFKIIDGHRLSLPRETVVFHPEQTRVYEEKHDIKQGKLVLGYRMNRPYEDDQYMAAFLGTVILGYGGSSKLFKEVREKASLCYSIYARAEKFKSILIVYAGVDFDKMDQAKALIIHCIEDLKNGEVSTEEVEIAKKSLIASLKSISDYPNAYINFYYNQYLTEGQVDIEEHIAKIEKITRDEIINAFNCVELDMVTKLTKETSDDI